MLTSFLLIFKFGYGIIRRLIHDAYFRVAPGSALLRMLLGGTRFFWKAEWRTFLQPLAYSAATWP